MTTDEQRILREQRLEALSLLLQFKAQIEKGPHHLYLDQLRTAVDESIDALEHRGTPSFRETWGFRGHGRA